MPLVVHLDYQRIAFLLKHSCDFDIERSITSDVSDDLLTVQTYYSIIIRGTEIHEHPFVRSRLVIEYIPVPYGTFIIVEILTLGVPVTWHHQGTVSVEVIFVQHCTVRIEIPVCKIGRGLSMRLHPVIVITVFERIDNGLPHSVQRNRLTAKHIHDLRSRSIFACTGSSAGYKHCCHQTYQLEIFHNRH